jgi:hypothetical protein
MSENPQRVQNSLKQIYNFNNLDDFEGPCSISKKSNGGYKLAQ